MREKVEARITEYDNSTHVEVKIVSIDNALKMWLGKMGFAFLPDSKKYVKRFTSKNSLDTFVNFITDNTIYKIHVTAHKETRAHAYFNGG